MFADNTLASYGFYVFLIVAGGAGEYLHLLPPGSLANVFFLVVGHLAGTSFSPSVNALRQNTAATVQNTAATRQPVEEKQS